MYRITITKFEPNPKYDPCYRSNIGYQELPEIEGNVLQTVLTDEEFKAIKKAVLEVM